MSAKDIAIVGIGCQFPKAPDLAQYWRNIRQARVCFSEVPKWRWNHDLYYHPGSRETDKAYARRVGFLDDVQSFAALHYGLAPLRVKVMDPQHRILLDAVRVAIEDAGYGAAGQGGASDRRARSFARQKTGVFIGASVSEYKDLVTSRLRAQSIFDGAYGRVPQLPPEITAAAVEDVLPVRAFSIAGNLLNMAAATVAQTFDLQGPAFTIDAACSSSLVAAYEAALYLRAGVCDAAIAGGVYLNLTPDNLVGFSRIGAISKTDACRPFDASADGFVLGEGVGVVMLKRLDDAIEHGDRIYAVIRGAGINNDGRGEGPMTPRREGQIASLASAYGELDFSPDTVGYIEAHGTGTGVGDVVEVSALKEYYGAHKRGDVDCYLSSVKANIGHTMSAAGVAGLIKASMVISERTIPPQAAFSTALPGLGLEEAGFHVATSERPWSASPDHPRRAAVSSFGFGGTNCHLVLEEAPSPSSRRARSFVAGAAPHPASVSSPVAQPATEGDKPRPETFVVSAHTPSLLSAHLEALHAALAESQAARASVADLAFSLSTRALEDARVTFVARTRDELSRKLLLARDAVSEGTGRTGIWYAARPLPEAERKVAFLFPGQGAQSIGLCRSLYERNAHFRGRLDALARGLDDLLPRPLLSYLYPELHRRSDGGPADADASDAAAAADAADAARATAALTATEICQPAMAALGLALADLAESVGLVPSVVVGHSLGEFVAAGAGGLLSPDAALRFVARRGRIMADLALEDPGAMAAVAGERSVVEQHIRSIEGVVVANVNHPQQVVLSGSTDGVLSAVARLAAAGLSTTRLPVSHAFHSPLVAAATDGIAALVAELELRPPHAAVVSCIAPGAYPADGDAARRIMIEHATAPVNFIEGVLAVAASGARVLVQVGAGTTLLAMARATMQRAGLRAAASVTLAAAVGDDTTPLHEALAELLCIGVPIQLSSLHEPGAAQLAWLPATPLETAHYWCVNRDERMHAPLPEIAPRAPSAASTTTAPPASAPNHNPASRSKAAVSENLVALFREQMAIFQAQNEIIRRQTEALGGASPESAPVADQRIEAPSTVAAARVPVAPAGVTPSAAASPASSAALAAPSAGLALAAGGAPASVVVQAPAATVMPAPSAADVAREIEESLIDLVAKVSAFPRGGIKLDQRLVADLGFDSLMIVELAGQASDRFVGLGGLPKTLFVNDTSVGDLLAHVVRTLAAAGSARAAAPAATQAPGELAIGRYAPMRVPSPLAPLPPGAEPPFAGPVEILADSLGVAPLLASLLSDAGRPAAVVYESASTQSAGASDPGARSFVDLRALVASSPSALDPGAMDAQRFRAPLDAALELARRASRTGAPSCIAFATTSVEGGGLAGFAKALSREWSETRVKAVSLFAGAAPHVMAAQLFAELTGSDATVEVEYDAEGQRSIFGLAPAAALATPASLQGGPLLHEGVVVAVSGGARGLGAKMALALAERHHARVLLLGRAEAGAEVRALVAAILAAGGKAVYAACDVRDGAAVTTALEEGRRQLGPIELVMHAAGLIADAPVGKKDEAQFAAVIDTKIAGALSLWQATAGDPLRAFLLFSSWAGRFGNATQTDYSAANHLLGQLSSTLGQARPSVRVVALDLPPWDDTAMVRTIPEVVRSVMRARGVPFLDDRTGTDLVLAELGGAGPSGEVLLAAGLPASESEAVLRVRLSLETHPYLGDHRLNDRLNDRENGTPVLPLAAAMDYAADAAQRLLGTPVTLRSFELLDGVRLVEGVAWLTVHARRELRGSDETPAQIELSWSATADGKRVPAYRATAERFVAGTELPALVIPTSEAAPSLPLADFYAKHTFHGPLLQGIVSVDGIGESHVRGVVRAAIPSELVVSASSFAVDPLLIDSSLQLAGYWAFVRHGRAGLPLGYTEFRQLRPIVPGSHVRCLVELERSSGDLFSGHIDYRDASGVLVAQLRGIRAAFPVVAAVTAAGAGGAAPAGPEIEIDPAYYRVEAFPEYMALRQKLDLAQAMGVANPYFNQHQRVTNDTTLIDGREMLNFSAYNYLGLSGDPDVSAAVNDAVARYGTSVSASRVASGEKPLHRELEGAIADFLGCEDSIVLVGGHSTNVSVIGHMVGPGDLVIHDSLAHDSIMGGAKLSGARRRPFPHNDWAALDRALTEVRGQFKKVLIAIEGTYSMDGDFPALDRFVEIKKRHKAFLLVDEAHSLGVLGKTGRGIGEHYGVVRSDVDMWMGTLSKTLASCGGYIAGSHALVEYLKYTNPGFTYSVGLSPPNTASALAAIRKMDAHPELVERIQARARFFLEACRARGINTGMSGGSAVIPCIVGSSWDSLQLAQALGRRGINVQPILYPAVEEHLARLRFFITALHSEEQLTCTADAIAEELAKLGPDYLKPPAASATLGTMPSTPTDVSEAGPIAR